MRDLDVAGIFWPAGLPDKRMPGRLKFDADSEAELEILGTFGDPGDLGMGQSSPMRIHGITDEQLLTLDNCMRTGAKSRLDAGPFQSESQEKYYVQYIFSGYYFSENDDLTFDVFRLRLHNLEYWIRKLQISDQLVSTKGENAKKKLHIVYSPMRDIEAKTDVGDIKLEFECNILHKDFSKYTIRQNSALALHFPEPRHLSCIVEDCFLLSHLVSIGIDGPTPMTSIEVSRKTIVQHPQSESEQANRKWIKLYARLQPDVPKLEGKTHPSEILFTFDSIGGLEKVARWIEVARKYEMVLGRLLLQRYSKSPLYADSIFFNAVSAAETLYRIQIGEQRVNLKRCLKDLSSNAGQVFLDLVGDVNLWANKVVQTRVTKVVHRGLDKNIQASSLYWLSESIYFLVVLCLLRECDVPAAVFDNVRNNIRFDLIASKLEELP